MSNAEATLRFKCCGFLAGAVLTCIMLGCDVPRAISDQKTDVSDTASGTSAEAPQRTAEIVLTDMRENSGISFSLKFPASGPIGIKETTGHGAAFLDGDGDGWLDVLLTGPNRVALFRNLGGWKFKLVENAGFRQEGYWQGIAVGDVNGDDRPDVFLSGLGCCGLFINRGENGFEDVTAAAGIDQVAQNLWQTSAAFADIDRDEDLDLYVTCYVDLAGKSGCCTYPGGVVTACNPLRFSPQRGILYRNLGDGRFQVATAELQFDAAHGNGLGVVAWDPNNDGYPDIYLANDQLPCDLFVNDQGQSFRERGAVSGTAFQLNGATQSGMGVDAGDYDNDGREDLVVSNYLHEPTSLYHNDGNLIFSNATQTSRLGPATTSTVGWGIKWVDLDNDGWLDLVIANGHPLHRIKDLDGSTESQQKFLVFRNRDGRSFVEITALGDGLPATIAGRALCVGDLNNDGKVDLLISNIEGEPLLLQNDTPEQNHWLSVRLADGPTIESTLVIARAGSREWIRRCSTGGSYLSASDSRVYFGLGEISALDELEVRWPSGRVTVLKDIKADQQLFIPSRGSGSCEAPNKKRLN